ncbi:MAG: YolD-like family protein [Lachnospiraceae bacterium]|nr:YolD-like family protein [Ruminococcus sp.]MCM1276421.1 YolD-like family protein [Lachnospiraceae bacterium]
MNRYENIIGHNRPKSNRPQMSMHDRAAQFSPFAALTGHSDAISETARRVDRKIELSEEKKEELGRKTDLILENPDSEIELVYFVPDKKKTGGSYVTFRGTVKKIDTIERKILLSDDTAVLFDDVLEISGDLFDGFFE